MQPFSTSQVEVKRKKGLYFYYNEKWRSVHKCKTQPYLVIPNNKQYDAEVIAEEAYDKEQQEEYEALLEDFKGSMIFLYTLSRVANKFQVIQFSTNIEKIMVSMLVDTGSTHYFINTSIIKKIEVKDVASLLLEVITGDNQKMNCIEKCAKVSLNI